MVLSIVQSTWCIFAAILLVAGWVAFLKKTQDAEWDSVTVAGHAIDRRQQRTMLAGASLLLYIRIAGQVIIRVVITFAVVAIAHGACHALPLLDSKMQPGPPIGWAEEP